MILLHPEFSDKILKSFYHVYNELQYGFKEKIYHNSMLIELRENGLKVESEKTVPVYYKQVIVGKYRADLIVENCIIIELKAQTTIKDAYEAQLLQYLKATPIEIGFVLNFGTKPEFVRRVFSNKRKQLPKH